MEGSCPFDWSNFTWNETHVAKDALHNLSFPCPLRVQINVSQSIWRLDTPVTFFIEVFRLSLSFCLLILLIALYNCVNILGHNVYSAATCSVYWILVFCLHATKSALLLIFIPLGATSPQTASDVNMAGFIVTTVVQLVTVFLLFIAIDHEYIFRSPDFASVDSPLRRRCVNLTWGRLFCSWYRVLILILTLLPLPLLVAVEIVFEINDSRAPSWLVWILVCSLLLPRLATMGMAVTVFVSNKNGLRPSWVARVYLLVGVALSLLEEVPSSVLTVAPSGLRHCTGDGPCLLVGMSVYDLFQLIGVLSLAFYTLFVRSQFLRIREECKLAMLGDLQKLLRVNGRKDVVAH